MAATGYYETVYANRGLSAEVPGIKPNRRPDVWGVRREGGKIDQVEVPSKTDTIEALTDRMNDTRAILGDRAGTIRIVPPKKVE